ncbi:MAG TPA: sulfite exporter TauE/SafE family protein, partial [Bacteroidota bacterium]
SPSTETANENRKSSWLIYPTMLFIGFYGGFIQVSVGFLFMVALYHIEKLSLVYVNMHKVTIVLMYTAPALAIYAWTGNVDWVLGAVLGIGSAIGGWWAAHASVKKGEKFIRAALVVAIVMMAAKLFGVY